MFCEEYMWVKNIVTLGHFELYLVKASGVKYGPSRID